MTKHEADVIGGLNMTDQISNEAYKQIMIVAQDENEVGDVLDKIKAEFINRYPKNYAGELDLGGSACHFSLNEILEIIDKYKAERSE